MKITAVLIIILIAFKSFGQEVKFNREQVQDDLKFLEHQLQKFHPNLYIYTSKKQIESCFIKLSASIPDSLNRIQCYNIIASTSSIVKDGHYNVFPSQETLNQFYTTTNLLPLDIFWTEDNAYIIRNYDDNTIELGAELQSINNIDVNQIRETILNRVLRDGNNTTYPYWILNNFFRAYYNFCFGASDRYEIVLSDENQTVLFNGLTHKEISEARIVKYPDYSISLKEEKGIDLKIDKTTATLTIRSFENKLIKENYDQKFKSSIKAHFQTITENSIDNLIIDIRGNQGGEVTNGIFLLKHLLSERFQAVQGFTRVNKKHYNSETRRNKPAGGKVDGFHSPFKNNFKGKLYLLVNGGSFSCSGIVAQTLKKAERSIIVGTETGGSAYTVVGAPNKEIILPNSKIQVTIPLQQFILQDYEKEIKTGVMPDIIIEPSLQQIVNNIDYEYNHILQLIAKSENQQRNP